MLHILCHTGGRSAWSSNMVMMVLPMSRSTNAGLMLAHRLRCWPTIKPALLDDSCLLGCCLPSQQNFPSVCRARSLTLVHAWYLRKHEALIQCHFNVPVKWLHICYSPRPQIHKAFGPSFHFEIIINVLVSSFCFIWISNLSGLSWRVYPSWICATYGLSWRVYLSYL